MLDSQHLGNLSFLPHQGDLAREVELRKQSSRGWFMGRGKSRSWLLLVILAVVTFVATPQKLVAQEVQGDLSKRVKFRVQPTYPELARTYER